MVSYELSASRPSHHSTWHGTHAPLSTVLHKLHDNTPVCTTCTLHYGTTFTSLRQFSVVYYKHFFLTVMDPDLDPSLDGVWIRILLTPWYYYVATVLLLLVLVLLS